MHRRTTAALALGALAIACASGAIGGPSGAVPPRTDLPTRIEAATPDGDAVLGGVIRDDQDEAVVGAWVTISCACLPAPLELASDVDGLYRVGGLPAGTYEVVFRRGRNEESRILALPAGVKFRMNVQLADTPMIIT